MAERASTSSSSSRRIKGPDDSIGLFVVDKEIGKGSFAQVYSGRHKVITLLPHVSPRPPFGALLFPLTRPFFVAGYRRTGCDQVR